MSATARLLATQGEVAEGLRRFLSPPAWLGAPGRPAQVRAAIERAVPELAAGALEVRRVQVRRLRLERDAAGWAGLYELELGQPGAQDSRVTVLGAHVTPPGFDEPPADAPAVPFDAPGWRTYLPELRLELHALPADPAPREPAGEPEGGMLDDLTRAALVGGSPADRDALEDAVRRAADGLAALHRSGAAAGATVTWEDELAALREHAGRLAVPLPDLDGAAEPLLRQLEILAATSPPDPLLPSYHALRQEPAPLRSEQAGLAVLESSGQAEPALDLSRFLCRARALTFAALQARSASEDEAGAQADALAELFLAAYERHAPVSRQRLALWETLALLGQVLECWTMIEPERLPAAVLLLDRHLRRMGVL